MADRTDRTDGDHRALEAAMNAPHQPALQAAMNAAYQPAIQAAMNAPCKLFHRAMQEPGDGQARRVAIMADPDTVAGENWAADMWARLVAAHPRELAGDMPRIPAAVVVNLMAKAWALGAHGARGEERSEARRLLDCVAETRRPALLRACAHCGRGIGADGEPVAVSHGICEECLPGVRAETERALAELKARTDRDGHGRARTGTEGNDLLPWEEGETSVCDLCGREFLAEDAETCGRCGAVFCPECVCDCDGEGGR